jgi:hypothetical protein
MDLFLKFGFASPSILVLKDSPWHFLEQHIRFAKCEGFT